MFTRAFWLATFERAVKTFAQAAGAVLLADATGVLNTDWGNVLSVAGMAALLSALTSVAAGTVSPSTGPSFGTETPGGTGRHVAR